MNINDIAKLKGALGCGIVLWHPDKDTARQVLQVSSCVIPPEEGDVMEFEPQPVDCAILTNGDHLSLEHSDLADFVVITPVAEYDALLASRGGSIALAS